MGGGLRRVRKALLDGAGGPTRRCGRPYSTVREARLGGPAVRGRRVPTRGSGVGDVADLYPQVARAGTQWDAAGSTSSTRTPPASLGCTKLTREPAVPRRGSSYNSRRPRSRSTDATVSTSVTR